MNTETAPRLFVETNFLLELALEQEQTAACEALLGLAEAGAITLSIPAFSVFEARSTIDQRAKKWSNYLDPVTR